MPFRRLDIGFRGRQSQWNIDQHQVQYSLHEFSLTRNIATSKPEVVLTLHQYEIEMQFRRLHTGFRGRQSQWNIDRHQVLHEFSLSGCMATSKPEVVITMCRYDIEMQFRRLHIGFRGRQSQSNIDRHHVLHSSA